MHNLGQNMKVYDTRNKMPTVYCPWEHIDEQKTKYTKETKALNYYMIQETNCYYMVLRNRTIENQKTCYNQWMCELNHINQDNRTSFTVNQSMMTKVLNIDIILLYDHWHKPLCWKQIVCCYVKMFVFGWLLLVYMCYVNVDYWLIHRNSRYSPKVQYSCNDNMVNGGFSWQWFHK